jgi:hypothetical protein
VVALVDGLHAKEVGGGGNGGDRAFAVPEHGGKVVGISLDGAFPHVKALDCSLVLEKATRQLEIRVGDGAMTIFVRDEGGRDVRREWRAPHDGDWSVGREGDALSRMLGRKGLERLGPVGGIWRWKPNTTGTQTRGVMSA